VTLNAAHINNPRGKSFENINLLACRERGSLREYNAAAAASQIPTLKISGNLLGFDAFDLSDLKFITSEKENARIKKT